MEIRSALYDANVLYPAPLRDLLMWLALSDLFQAKWTDRIHEEWITNVLEDRPDLTRQHLDRTRDLMNAHVRDCLVEGYEDLIEGLTLPDPNDRHVLAAAIKGGADVIVTLNLKDFPQDMLAPYGIEAQHPDTFISGLLDRDEETVWDAVRQQRSNLKNPPIPAQKLLDILERQGLQMTVARLRRYVDRF